MITGVIAREEHWKTIQALNFRGEHDIRRITAGSPNAAQRELEGNGEYNLLILDIDVFHGNSDIAVSLVERLKKSVPQLQLALIMDGYTSNSLVVRDIKSIGVEEDHIIFGGGAKLKQQINYILHETVQRKENEIDSPEEVKQIPQQLPPAGTITPPSQIDRQSAKSMMIPKQPVRSDIPRAVTIAVAGAGPRMGTTTQAMAWKEKRRQQQLKAQYGIDRPDVVVVERKNVFVITLRVILHAAYIALRICASCAVAVLAIIGLASLIYPNIRAELVNSLGQVMDELQAFLA